MSALKEMFVQLIRIVLILMAHISAFVNLDTEENRQMLCNAMVNTIIQLYKVIIIIIIIQI